MTTKRQRHGEGRGRLRLVAVCFGGSGTLLVGLLGFPLRVQQALGYPLGYWQTWWNVLLSWLGLLLLVIGFLLAVWAEIRAPRARRALGTRGEEAP